MKYDIKINQLVIVENGWNEVSDLDTWALFDFLCFFNNLDKHKTINDGEFKWINYTYLNKSLPLCKFYKQKVKKHLEILESFGLIALEKDELKNVYFKLLPKHKIMFERVELCDENFYLGRKNFTQGWVKNYPGGGENFTHKNNKESKIINNKESYPRVSKDTLPPKGDDFCQNTSLEVGTKTKDKQHNIDKDFNEFWSLYPKERAIDKPKCFKLWTKIIKEFNKDQIIEAIKGYLHYWQSENTPMQYIPHCTTWLNQQRYLNVPKSVKAKKMLWGVSGQYLDEDTIF